jgi:hypothetical protein
MDNDDGWPTEGPDKMRCPRCHELHTAWVLNEMTLGGKVVYRQCNYCRFNTDVLFEMGVPITRAEDKADAEDHK